ncbi:GumC family protein [Bacteroides sp.]
MKEFISDESFEETDNKDELKTILFNYLIHWKWFILSIILCWAGSWFYLRYATPVYNVSATVMIKDDKKGSRASEMLALEDMGFLSSSGSIENEMEILRSKSLIKQAVTSLKIYATYTTKGHIGSRDLYNESPIAVEMTAADLNKLKTGFSFEVVLQPDSTLNLSGNIGGKDISTHISRLPILLDTPAGRLTLSLRPETQPIYDETIYIHITPPLQMAKAYLGALNISGTSNTTSIANISIQTTNKQRGEDFVNKLIEVYNQDASNDKKLIATKTAEFIDERIVIINRELGSTEAELENFKRNAGLTSLNDAQTFVQESSEYEKKRMDIGTQLNLMEYLRTYINNPANQDAVIPSNVGVNDVTLSALINKYNEMILERNRLLRTSSESNPVIVRKNNDLSAMRASIKSAINSVYQGLLISKGDIERQASKYSNRIDQAPTQERALTGIARQQEIKAGLYMMLLQKREENSIALAATADNAKIIDAATANDLPIAPNYSLIRMIAVVVGLLIPVVVITLINFFRLRIEGHADVEKLTRIPILCDIPTNYTQRNSSTTIVVKENENSIMSEVFRSLRTNLQFILGKKENKVILITSTTSGEGKTFISCNLGVSLALLGKRVVIVGLDIRKPKLAEYFDIDQKHLKGITSYLADDSIDLHSLLLPVQANPNLWLLPSGSVPPNPAELLARPSLDKAIAQLAQEFDYVILDTAPVGMVTDTLILSRVANASIYVCRADYSYKSDFELINELKKENKLPEISVVINGIDMKKKKYGYYYGYGKKYGYGRRYGYGYGYGDGNK